MRKAHKKIYYISPSNSVRITEIVERIGGSVNEGAELFNKKCSKHGEILHLRILNEGGYNGTDACLLCIKELIRELNI